MRSRAYKSLAIVLSLALLLCIGIGHLASAQDVDPGETVYFSISLEQTDGVQGELSFSNGAIIDSVSVNVPGMMTSFNNNKLFAFVNANIDTGVYVQVHISVSAQPGDECTITLKYKQSRNQAIVTPDYVYRSWTVVVRGATEAPTEPPTQPPTQPTQPRPTQPPTTAVQLDLTELERQIAIAESLDEFEYTQESWDALLAALENARAARSAQTQDDVDAAAKALANAIAALVKLDFSALLEAINAAEQLSIDTECGQLWKQLFDALEEAQDAMHSRSQATIDAVAVKILDILAQIIAYHASLEGNTELVEVTVPVEVTRIVTETVEVTREVEKPLTLLQTLWPWIAGISLAGNGLLAAILLLGGRKKKNNETDDTPLIDYNIEDDN